MRLHADQARVNSHSSPISPPERVRLAQAEFGCSRWDPVEATDDAGLVDQGRATGGPGLDLSGLEPSARVELLGLLTLGRGDPDRPGNQTRAQERREREILAQVPRYGWVPPIDVDLCEESAAYSPESTRALAADYRDALDGALETAGLGRPSWWATNDRGGSHGHVDVSTVPGHPRLVEGVGVLVREAARAAGVPLLSDLPRAKSDRPAVYVDDTLYSRGPSGRGGVWRLPGSRKRPEDPPLSRIDQIEQDLFNLNKSCSRTALDRALAGLVDLPAPGDLPADRETIGDLRPADALDLAALEARSIRLRSLWTADSGDRSRDDWAFACGALEERLALDRVARLVFSRPAGKGWSRGERYVEATTRKAAAAVDLARRAGSFRVISADPARTMVNPSPGRPCPRRFGEVRAGSRGNGMIRVGDCGRWECAVDVYIRAQAWLDHLGAILDEEERVHIYRLPVDLDRHLDEDPTLDPERGVIAAWARLYRVLHKGGMAGRYARIKGRDEWLVVAVLDADLEVAEIMSGSDSVGLIADTLRGICETLPGQRRVQAGKKWGGPAKGDPLEAEPEIVTDEEPETWTTIGRFGGRRLDTLIRVAGEEGYLLRPPSRYVHGEQSGSVAMVRTPMPLEEWVGATLAREYGSPITEEQKEERARRLHIQTSGSTSARGEERLEGLDDHYDVLERHAIQALEMEEELAAVG